MKQQSDRLNQYHTCLVMDGNMGKISEAFFELLGVSNPKGKKTSTVRTEFYRGHLLKRNVAHKEYWSVTISDKAFVGKLEFIKMSVDHWCENKVLVAPDYFEKNHKEYSESQTIEYKGFVLKNDRGGANDWYVTYRGRLMKGSKQKIEKAIDELEERMLAQKSS